MALRSPLTVQPYDYIADSNGRPLDYGQVYIGVANQDPEFYQIPVYLDAAMTKPVDQPIRTNDGFVDFAGSLSELYASAEVYSVKVLDKQGRKVLYKGDMTRKNLMSDALADLNQSIIDTQTAAQITLNAAVNSANTEVAQTVSLATAAIDTATTKSNKAATDADAAITQMFENGGLPATPFATKALMTASALVDGKYAMVTDDTVNNGLYVKTAGAWVKSEYDPLTQAKADATTKANTAKGEAITESVTQSTNNTKTIVAEATKYIAQTDSAALHQWADENDLVVGSINSNAEFEAQDFKTEKGRLSTVLEVLVEVVDLMDIPDYAHVFSDSDGNILMGIKQDGSIVGGSSGGSGLAEMRAGILNSIEMNEVGLALDSKYLDDVPLNYDVLVAEHGSDDTLHQRMPSAIKLSDTLMYVAFSQFSYLGQDGRDGRLVGRFVTYDLDAKTSTVGATQVIDGNKLGSLSRHPVFIELRDKIVLLFNDGSDLVQMESVDNCQTWINRHSISIEGHPTFLGLDTAVQIQHGKFAGRVCVTTYNRSSTAIVYSDDDCVTWEKGGVLEGDVAFPSTPALTEPSITLDASQNIVMVIRNETSGTSSRYVLFAKSMDGGNTLQPVGIDPVLPSSQCQMGFKQFAPDLVNVPKIILSHPTFQSFSRQQFRVRLSYDNCQSFVTEYAPFADNYHVAYSSVCILDNKTFALLYEDGSTNQTQSINIKFLNLSEII